jgi:hypothetical protein
LALTLTFGCIPEPATGPQAEENDADAEVIVTTDSDAAIEADVAERDVVAERPRVTPSWDASVSPPQPMTVPVDAQAPQDTDAELDAGPDAEVDARVCESLPSPPRPSAVAPVSAWTEAWVVPVAFAERGTHMSVGDGLGNTFLSNALPWHGALPVPASERPNDVLASSVDADGNLRWVVRTNGAAPSVSTLLPTEDGGVVVAFHCAGTVSPAMIRCGSDADYALVLARFDASGTLRWSRSWTRARVGGSGSRDLPLVRDGDGNLYTLFAQSEADASTVGTFASVDSRGELRWSRPASVGDDASLWMRAGELQAFRVRDPWAPSARIEWERLGLDGTPRGQGVIPLDGVTLYRGIGMVVPGPDGDFYVVQHSIQLGSITNSVSLKRIDACGRSRWETASYLQHGSAFIQQFDASGNVCLITVEASLREERAPIDRCTPSYQWATLSVYSPEGNVLQSATTGTFYQYSSVPLDRVPHCALSASPRGVSMLAPRAPTAFTAGVRLDTVGEQDALVRYVATPTTGCPSGLQRCGGRCENTSTHADHCGACGNACRFTHGVGRCGGGRCYLGGCEEGFADCNGDSADGCEADLRTSANHCGVCGRACSTTCAQGLCCAGSTCTPPFASDGHEGPFAPRGNVTMLAGVHHYTSITIPEGVTVRVDGNGVLDLRASSDVNIHGVIDLSGGDGESFSSAFLGAPGGGGGNTGRAGFGASGANGAGPGGGGSGEGTPASGSGSGESATPRAGLGVAGGASGHGACGQYCSTREAASGVDGGRDLYGVMEGGRAWGAPYQGAGSTPLMTTCFREPGFSGFGAPLVYFTNGVPAGGGSIGRAAAADLGVFTTFHPGSGGGGGGSSFISSTWRDTPGGGGGGGGGALRIASATRISVSATGRVRANGGAGGRNAAAGSGGVVYLAAPSIHVAPGAIVEAIARDAPPNTGLGRIRLSVDPTRCALAGSFNPPLRDGCAPTAGGVPGFSYIGAWPR